MKSIRNQKYTILKSKYNAINSFRRLILQQPITSTTMYFKFHYNQNIWGHFSNIYLGKARIFKNRENRELFLTTNGWKGLE